ncbi:ABC transporter substrate-binding protein [Methylobacterium aquaticum]|jgi:branched-chain amino acid transport system substrate-binding protein|uniref:ABC transporter substrate-binding protein n=1 Tax=Methylobacterium aquaticum TaxID=270351 RepID=UPI0007C7E6D2|nr:ABC transporter substrate-binding protein [Methylobacterium aquaticum]
MQISNYTSIAPTRRRALGLALGAAAVSAGLARPARGAEPLRIGVLVDMSGPFSDYSGPTSVAAAQMAVAEFEQVLGRPVEIISADHQNKPDVGSAIAREWFDRRGVEAIADLTSSAVALAVQKLAADRGKVTLLTGPATGALMNESCSRTGFQWVLDTYSNTVGPSRMLMQQGLASWYLIVADYAYGHQMQRDLTRSVVAAGGKVLGASLHPVSTADFSSFLLQAEVSKAQVVGMLNAGSDLINSVKQAAEFGLTQTQKFFLPGAVISDIHALGLAQAQGLLLMNGFYWDRNDESRAWSKEFYAKTRRMPGQIQAGTYSAVRHYLRCCEAAQTVEGLAVAEKMRGTLVDDVFVRGGTIRPDGRLVHDFYVVQVKSPAESKAPWDYYKQVGSIAGSDAMQPLSETRCPYLIKP